MKTLIIFLFASIVLFSQDSGDLRYGNGRIEIFLDNEMPITEYSEYIDSSDQLTNFFRSVYGWFSVDSLFRAEGNYFPCRDGDIALWYILSEKQMFNAFMEEWWEKKYSLPAIYNHK